MAGITFRGKSAVQNHHLTVPFHELVPLPDLSVSDGVSLDDNLLIHADNLIALKALLPTHAGRVDRVYIDPPYNTGNQKSQTWTYDDRVDSPLIRDWLNKEVTAEDLTRHDKWLAMMMPRLRLVRELMADTGLIFVSIDWNELHHLRMLMNEVFGEQNFLAILTWRQLHTVRNSSNTFSQNTEYIVVFAKNLSVCVSSGDQQTWLRLPADKEASYPYDDDDGKGRYKLDPLWSRNEMKRYKHKFANGMEWEAPADGFPRYSETSLDEMEAGNELVFPGSKMKKAGGKWQDYRGGEISAKRYFERVLEGIPASTLLPSELVGFSKDGTSDLAALFEDEKVFFQPKPVSLIKHLLRIERLCDRGNDYLILDSFAGSGTTGQAVLELNRETGRNHRFILVEMEDDYADSVTAERIRRVIAGVPKSPRKDSQTGTGGSFSYFELGKAVSASTLLEDEELPAFGDLARYVFFTATGRDLDPKVIDEASGFIGETEEYKVFMFYRPDRDWLKTAALNLETARGLGPNDDGKTRVVFAPSRYLDADQLSEMSIQYCQLPFDIFRLKG